MLSVWFIVSCFFMFGVFCDNKDGGKAYRIPLNDGSSIPAIGLGTFLGFDEKGPLEVKEHEVKNAVNWAISAGYRMLDTAAAYDDEDQVGAGVRASSVPRENIYVVTKLATHEQRKPLEALRSSLTRLNMTYVDLYLIHNPMAFKGIFASGLVTQVLADSSPKVSQYKEETLPASWEHFSEFDPVDYLDTWKSLVEAKKLGLAKSIGVSNFNISQIERILANSDVKPAVLQVEVNLNLAQNKLVEFCKSNDIVVMAFTPFGSLFTKSSTPPPPRADDPALVNIARKYKKTTPQIVLRYLVQRGVVPIPKSVNKNRIEENVDVFNFELTAEEMDTLSKFNKDFRTVNMSFWQDHPYYPFEREDMPAPNPFKGLKE